MVAGVAVVAVSGVLHASAETNLTPRTAAQLLADLRTADTPVFDGTVVENAALGLPDIPQTGSGGAGGTDTSLVGLLTGSHTVKIWYGGPQRQRLALLGTIGETDVFHDGAQMWQWDSNNRTATHVVLPPEAADRAPSPQQTGALTPQQLAQQALDAIDPTTTVGVDSDVVVAGQKCYQLVLQPKDGSSHIGSVRIAVDGATKLPLRVQVFGRTAGSDPALDVSFTSVTYAEPDASMFNFTPPAGATVRQMSVSPQSGSPQSGSPQSGSPQSGSPQSGSPRSGSAQSGGVRAADPQDGLMSEPQVFGTGWTSVVMLRMPAAASGTPGASGEMSALLEALPAVSGSWGSGRLLDSSLLSALVTDDGRIFVGPVDPAVLYAAATAHR